MNVYEIVTNRIIEALEKGFIPWKQPWTGNARHPRNLASKKPYRGVNVLLLWPGTYRSPFWLSFRQALAMGGCVRKGQKGTPIVFWKVDSKAASSPTNADETEDRRFILRYYTVFNTEQCDGIAVPPIEEKLNDLEPIAHCERIVESWDRKPALVLNDANQHRAFYQRNTDAVHMPIMQRFASAEHYYSTLFHELVHATGSPDRLDREKGKAFGDDPYCREELVAETGSAFLAAVAGIDNKDVEQNTVAYIQNWISALKADARMMVVAAAQAQRAVDMILMNSPDAEAEPE